MLEQHTGELVYGRELGEIACVCAGCFVYEPDLLADAIVQQMSEEAIVGPRERRLGMRTSTYVPDRKRKIMLKNSMRLLALLDSYGERGAGKPYTSAWGKRTLVP